MTADRLRGRAGQEARARRLKVHPLCAKCERRGLVRATDEIDHIVPLAFGGRDVDENTQGLCFVCHAIKTATESPSHGAASNHPEWLKPALGPLSIVVGPPLSGKSKLARRLAGKHGVVIDQGDIMARLSPAYRPWAGAIDPDLINRSIRIRNALLGDLASAPKRRAALVLSAPSKAEREWWHEQLGGTVVLSDPGIEACRARAQKLRLPSAIPAIERWYDARYQRWAGLPRRRLPRVGSDANGYPLES